MSTIHARHSQPSRRPYNMSRIHLSADEREAVERIAIGVFADMVNAGMSFQQALAAIYLSGAQHASEAQK